MFEKSIALHRIRNYFFLTHCMVLAPIFSQIPLVETNDFKSVVAYDFNINAKKAKTVNLVTRAVRHFQHHGPQHSCSDFVRTKKFVDGELALFVFNNKGYCLAYGNDPAYLWRNMYDTRDFFGNFFVQDILSKGRAGGGWVSYEEKRSTKIAYVQNVDFQGETYTLGSGFFPHSKENSALTLVKGAVSSFNYIVRSGRPIKEAFAAMSYPVGQFVFGDLYINAYNFKGVVYADGEQPGLIGSYRLNVVDRNGEYPVQKMVNAVKDKEAGVGVWVEFERRNAIKRTYVERVTDADGQQYIISCGYYPDVTPEKVIDLVRRGYEFLRKVGIQKATFSFTDVNDHTYNYGGTSLAVYTLTGDCLADGNNPDNVDHNFFKAQDEDGRYYIQAILRKAQRGGGWINTRLKNSLVSFYVLNVPVGEKTVVLVSSLFPITKQQRIVLLVKSAVEYLQEHDAIHAFSRFVDPTSRYVRGDLDIMVFDSEGTCYAYGFDRDLIWRNLIQFQDDDGRPFIKTLINTALNGPGTIQYTLNGSSKVAYVEQVEKDGQFYTIGSSFYL